ncbi:hypothetical protein HDU67_001638, partial [Dinochytrium kinnereticum]
MSASQDIRVNDLKLLIVNKSRNFFEANEPTRGRQWNLPPASELPPIPKSGPGFGCFNAPNSSVGYPLFENASKDCGPGFFCPYYELGNPSTQPVACPADPTCQYFRISGVSCMPQGRYEPIPCITGNYCPNPRTILPCPPGHFCPRGTVKPIKCQFLSLCPAGTTIQAHYGLLLIMLSIDVLIALVLFFKRIRELKRANQPLYSIFPSFIVARFSRQQEKRQRNDPAGTALKIRDETFVDMNEAIKVETRVTKLVDGVREALGKDLRMDFSFSDLSLRLPSGVTVLQGVSGEIKAGRMTAIMGPSGAGKTTFMNVLMGKVTRTGGELRINGVAAEMQKYKKIIGYVPQEDIMLRELTVRENITYSARVRLPGSWSSSKVAEHVDHVIDALSLKSVAESQIGDDFSRGISGGQRKR